MSMALKGVALVAFVLGLAQAAHQPYDVRKIIDAFRHPRDDLKMICAHRGLRWNGTADNSWDAYYRATQAGIECIETDIRQSSDGVLAMIHDSGLGRETNIGEFTGQAAYNPFTAQGYNPKLSETPWRGVIENLHVRDEAGRVKSEMVETLPDMVMKIRDAGVNVVLQLDVKEKAAVEYMYWALKPLANAAGVPANEWCIYKLQASWWHTPADLEAEAWVQDAFANNISLAYIPVVSVDDAEEFDVVQAAEAWAKTNYTISVEVNMKSNQSAISDLQRWIHSDRSEAAPFRTSGVFYAPGDFIEPIASDITFYDTANYTLPDDIRVNGTAYTFQDGRAPMTLDSVTSKEDSPDGHDYRSDLAWIFDNGYNWIIADTGDDIAAKLKAEGKRNIGYMIADGEQVVDEQLARGWYRRHARDFV